MRLRNAVEPMDRWTAALDTHSTAITGINTGETLALGTVDDRFAEVLQTAGVPLTVALNNSQEPMSRMAAALETYNSNPVVFGAPQAPLALSPGQVGGNLQVGGVHSGSRFHKRRLHRVRHRSITPSTQTQTLLHTIR